MNKNIADIRTDYSKQALNRHEVDPNPILQFNKWFDEAKESSIKDVNAFTLSTADKDGRPSGRIVLLKGVEHGNFLFYTNYESQKGKELNNNPFAAITFYWPELERQVRIQGKVSRTSPENSNKYFQSRPRKSRIGAWISQQSQPVPSRIHLMRDFVTFSMKLLGGKVDLPPHWGGYAIAPCT